jgi:hypothetical protein
VPRRRRRTPRRSAAGLHDRAQQLTALQDRAHAIQVETLKLCAGQERFRERQAQIDASLAEMAAEEESESERLGSPTQPSIATQRVSELQTVMPLPRGYSSNRPSGAARRA